MMMFVVLWWKWQWRLWWWWGVVAYIDYNYRWVWQWYWWWCSLLRSLKEFEGNVNRCNTHTTGSGVTHTKGSYLMLVQIGWGWMGWYFSVAWCGDVVSGKMWYCVMCPGKCDVVPVWLQRRAASPTGICPKPSTRPPCPHSEKYRRVGRWQDCDYLHIY